MSGHSKWSKVKHQKATTDAAKSSEFTKASRAITVAVREGGGGTDVSGNFRLRMALENAHAVNMPKETIARAIERASSAGENLSEVLYEGYGPGGIAMMVVGVTDNKQRTAAIVKHLFDRFGGSLAGPGAVGYLFNRVGTFTVAHGPPSEAMLDKALAAGAVDMEEEGEGNYTIYTPDGALHAVSDALVRDGMAISDAKIIYRPVAHMEVSDDTRGQTNQLARQLSDLDDVSQVYTNL